MTTNFTPQEIAQAVAKLSAPAQLELKAILFENRCHQLEDQLMHQLPELDEEEDAA